MSIKALRLRHSPCVGGRNFSIPIPGANGVSEQSTGSVTSDNEIVRQIAEAENSDQWTLMHRFNRAADLLDQAVNVKLLQYYWSSCFDLCRLYRKAEEYTDAKCLFCADCTCKY